MADKFPSSQAGDFAVLESGIVSEETYIQQQQYWETLYQPLIKYILDTYKPDLAMVGYPGTDEIQHQFLGLVTKKLPERREQPGVRRHRGQRHAGPSRQAARGVHPRGLRGLRRDDAAGPAAHAHEQAEHVRVVRPRLRAAVRGDRRQQAARRPRAAVDRRPPTAASTPTRHRGPVETIGKAKACWAGGALQVYLNLAGPRPGERDQPFQQVPAAERGVHGRRRSATRSRASRTPTTGPATASPRAGRSSTARSPRPRRATSRTAPTARPTWRTRRGPATSSCSRSRRTSSTPRRPGTLIARSQFFGQHGYVPDVQELKSNTNMRATFLAGGPAIKDGKVRRRAQHRPRADGGVPARRPGAAAEPGHRAP